MKTALVILALGLFSCADTRSISPREVAAERENLAKIESAEQKVTDLTAEVERLKKERTQIIEASKALTQEIDRLRRELKSNESAKSFQRHERQEVMLAKTVPGRKPRLIVFTALEWCVPCQKYQIELDRLGKMVYVVDGKEHTWIEDIGSDDSKCVQVLDCSDENGEEFKLATSYGVGQYPTTIKVDDDGTLGDRYSGVIAAERLPEWVLGRWKPPRKLDSIIKVE